MISSARQNHLTSGPDQGESAHHAALKPARLRRAPRKWAWGLCAAAALVSGCATRESSTDAFLGLITPYRIEIVQGNPVTKEQAALVKPGMSREQVRAVLGSPMLSDPFHVDRWDYIFAIRRQGLEPQRRSVVAHFKNNVLSKLDAPDNLPSEEEFVASIAPARRATAAAPVLELSEEQRKALPKTAKTGGESGAKPAATAAVPRNFPPLEP